MSGRPWTPEELDRLRSMYPSHPTLVIATELGRGLCCVYRRAAVLGLQKSAEFLASPESGRLRKGQSRPGSEATQFKSGQIPVNKGLRRPGWSSGRMSETQFRKGQRSGKAAQNWKPLGTILRDTEGYLRIKVREAEYGKEASGFGNTKVWPLLNRHVWEQAHGPIPPSHSIAFLDGDRSNCTIENLECVSRADMARRNCMWGRLPQDLAEAIQLNGALKRKLRNLSNEKQNVGPAQPSV